MIEGPKMDLVVRVIIFNVIECGFRSSSEVEQVGIGLVGRGLERFKYLYRNQDPDLDELLFGHNDGSVN